MIRALIFFSFLLSSSASADSTIQIGIAHKVNNLILVPQGRLLLIDKADGMRAELEPGNDYLLERSGFRSMRLGPMKLSRQATLEPLDDSDGVLIDHKTYKGRLLLKLNDDGTVTVIEEMRIEDYLLGVLPHEMDASWPLEALRAQAVVARTFAYAQLGKFRKFGFDLTSDTKSQVYGGVAEVSESVRLAVEQTRGEVLGYGGELLQVYYHSSCGGHTTSPAAVWGPAGPTPEPLRGVRDRYCARSPYRKWKVYFSDAEIRDAIMPRRLTGAVVRWIRPVKKDPAGFVRLFRVRVGNDTLLVKALDLRRRLGNVELKSVKILKSVKTKNGFKFVGRGSGHGVGLCQWGARIQAEKGRRYEKILDFYFPGSTLSLIDE